MADLEEAGWKKAEEKSADQVTDVDIKSIFNLVDIDKSGTVSRTVCDITALSELIVFILWKEWNWIVKQ